MMKNQANLPYITSKTANNSPADRQRHISNH